MWVLSRILIYVGVVAECVAEIHYQLSQSDLGSLVRIAVIRDHNRRYLVLRDFNEAKEVLIISILDI